MANETTRDFGRELKIELQTISKRYWLCQKIKTGVTENSVIQMVPF